jgi:hypothetical protein
MKLRFFAKDDAMVPVPGVPRVAGQPKQYVGRRLVRAEGKPPSYPATEEAFEIDSDTDDGRQLVRRVRTETERHDAQPLWPADKATAEACGVPFVAVTVKDGIAIPAGNPAPQRAPKVKDEA